MTAVFNAYIGPSVAIQWAVIARYPPLFCADQQSAVTETRPTEDYDVGSVLVRLQERMTDPQFLDKLAEEILPTQYDLLANGPAVRDLLVLEALAEHEKQRSEFWLLNDRQRLMERVQVSIVNISI